VKATAVATVDQAVCATRASGGVACFGTSEVVPAPAGSWQPLSWVDVPGVTGVEGVSMGDYHGCAWGDGRASCWGRAENGRLGDGGGTFSVTPVVVPLPGR
jgi:hypothetical protein